MNEIGPDAWWNPFYLWHLTVKRARLRPCKGCSDTSFHTAHFTVYGRWHYVWRYALRRRLTSLRTHG